MHLLFTLKFGWRLWRGQRLQWSLLALGLGCFSALLLLLLQLGPQLRTPLPGWAQPADLVATVHRTDPQGRYRPVSNAELYRLKRQPEVTALAIAQFEGSELRIAEQNIDRTKLMYYSENLPAVLGLKAPFTRPDAGQAQQVYLSHWLWQLLGKPEVQGLDVLVRENDKRYVIAAVLPPALDRFSEKRPGLWLPWEDRFLPYSQMDKGNNLAKGPGPKALAFTENMPDSVGFIQYKAGSDLTKLAQNYDAMSVEWLGLQAFKMLEDKHQADIIPGIELFPEQRADLLQQFWLLCCLTLLCGAVVAINLVFCLIGQLVQRQHEMGMRQVLGARSLQLSRQLALEQLPLWCAAVAIGGLLYWQGAGLLAGLKVYQQYFGSAGVPFDWGYAAIAVLGLTVFLLLCSQLPLLWLLRRARMFRNRQGQRNLLQQRLAWAQQVLQLSFAGLALVLALSLQFQLLQQEKTISRWLPFEELQLRLNPGIQPDAKLQRGEFGVYTPEQVALSVPFTEPEERKLTTTVAGHSLEVFVGSVMVSSNYLQFLGAELLAGDTATDGDSIVINQTLADRLLEPGQTYADLPGTTLSYMVPFSVQTQIRGVIHNLPHRGVAAASIPIMYSQLKPNGFMPYSNLTLTTAPALVDEVTTALEDWADRQGQDLDISYRGTLATQLEQMNEPYWIFARISLLLAGVISLLAALSLYYQLKTQLLLEQSLLATKLAVGATVPGLISRLCGHQLGLLLFSVPVCALLLWGLSPWLSGKLGAPVFQHSAVLPALVIMLALVLLATALPALRLLQKPIALLLQGRAT
ncbi:FtsX-like permease family protein [Rheinheimera tilapiae]|uniref:FtsX-like permease family protein n=1 Tax=Rheinheimera tilapiae TaxID=875043 RepID=A0ABV6BFV6_9GAMM